MFFRRLITYFLPDHLRKNKLDPSYNEWYVIVSGAMSAVLLLILSFFVLHWLNIEIPEFLYHAVLLCALLPCIKYNIYAKVVDVNGLLGYCIYFPVLLRTGGIYSVNVSFLYIYLLGALWGNKNGILYVVSNIAVLVLLYLQTPYNAVIGSKAYPFLFTHFVRYLSQQFFGPYKRRKTT